MKMSVSGCAFLPARFEGFCTLKRNFLFFFLFVLSQFGYGINIIVDDWGNLTASQQTVTQAVLDDWESMLPNVAHDFHLTFNYVGFTSVSSMTVDRPDAEWAMVVVTNAQTKSVEEVAIGVSFNFTEDGDDRPISCDIEMNSNVPWHVGLDAPPGGLYDWYSVMSHEVCHALGFTVYYTRFARNVTDGPDTNRTYNDGGTPTATLVPSTSGTHLSATYHPNFLMNPSIGSGVRREPSALENDLLWHDIWSYPDPDLTYGSESLSVAGTVVDISLRARNISAITGSDEFHVGYYLSVNDYITTSDYRIGTDYVLPLPANSYSPESISIDVRSIDPPIPPGTYYVGFLIDYQYVIDEITESNNRFAFASPLVTISQMNAPTGVAASDGTYSDHIHVSWNAVSGATHYKVYRGISTDPGSAVAITGWQTATTLDDYLPAGDRYYYWVKAAASFYGSGESGFSAYNSGYVLPISLTSDSQQSVTDDPTFYYTNMSANDNLWWVVGIRHAVDGENWSLILYSDPSCNDELVSSTYEERVDFVVVDGHHVADTDRGVMCYRFRGTHDAMVEFEGHSETLLVGDNTGIAWPAGDVVEMWTVALTPGTYRFDLTFNSGTNDLGFALFSSSDGDYYRTRHEYVGKADNVAGGMDESFIYTVTGSDNYGLCVWANGTTAANFDIAITALSAGLWEGDVSSNWHTPGNWNDVQVPDTLDDVVIPAGTPFSPVISAAAADCHNLTVETGATITITDETVTIGNNLVCYGHFNMNHTGSRAYIGNDLLWEDGSTCTMLNSARMYVSGDWEFKAGADVVLNSGYVEFTGTAIGWIRSYESGCRLHNVLCRKTAPGYLGVSAQCVDELHINNLYLWTSVFHSYSHYPVIIDGFMNSVYDTAHFQWHSGTLVLNGANAVDFKPNVGDYLQDLVIDTVGVINCSTNYHDTLTVNGDLTITGGGLCPNNVTLEVGGNWSNAVGTAGFTEGTDTVRFFGANKSEILTDETFYYVYVDKSYASYDDLQIAADRTVTVLNDLYINSGTVEMESGSVLDINDDLFIISGAGLNANDANTTVHLYDEWYNYNATFSSYVGFDPGLTSTFIFDGGNNQYMYAEDPLTPEVFANLTVDKSGGSLMLEEPVHVRGDCLILNGGWSRFAASTGMTHIFDGDLLVGSGGVWLDDSSGSTIRFEGGATADISYEGASGAFNEVVVAKSVGTTIEMLSDISVNGTLLHVDSGVLELDGKTLACAGGVTVDADGELYVNLGSTLAVGSGYVLEVTGGGRFEAAGGRAGNPLVTRTGSGSYSFNVRRGATIGAQNCTFEYMDGNGVYVYDTGLIDPAMPFNGCVFRNGPGSGAFLRVDNSEKHTIINAVFPTSMASGYNVAKTLDQGDLKFVHATGVFAGEKFDYDLYDRIDWATGAITAMVISGPSWCTLNGEYMFSAQVTGDSVLTPINYNIQITDHSTVNHYHSSLTDLIEASWASPGSKLIRVEASNDAGSLVRTLGVEVAPLCIDNIVAAPGSCGITLGGTSSGSAYCLEFCTNLQENIWIPLDDVAGSDNTTLICPPYGTGGIPSNAPSVFFRALLRPGSGL